MKYLLTLGLCLAFLSLSAQQKAPAVVYLETMGVEFEAVSRETMSYASAAAHSKGARKIEKRRQELLSRIQLAERNVRKMKPFENDATLRDSVVLYFDLTYKVLTDDFGKIVNMEEIAEQSYDAMEAYMKAKEMAGDKLDLAYEGVVKTQENFLKKNNIKVVSSSSKLSEKLKEASAVRRYYDRIYLIFFKSFKDEIYMLDALSGSDVNAKEQTKNALLQSATDGLSQLGPIAPYRGDATMKAACQKLLNFYKKEASEAMAGLVDFELKKENFEKIKKAFDAKKESSRTQADIDLYNQAVNEYNAAANKVNAQQNELNKTREELFKQWNKVSDEFLDRHTPRYAG
jgi:hypothetical protein